MKIKLINVMLVIVLIELFLGGSGRLLTLPFDGTFRMLLYLACLGYVLIQILSGKLSKLNSSIFFMILFWLSMVLTSTLLGVVNGNDGVFIDVKPLLYFPMIIFFSLALKDDYITSTLVMKSGLLMALLYLIFLFFMFNGYIDFLSIYEPLTNTGEFFFRGGSFEAPSFFYKGFLFMAIAVIFYWCQGTYKAKFISIVIFAAVLLTLTRGLVISLAIVLIISCFLHVKNKLNVLLLILLFVTVSILLFSGGYLSEYFSRPESDIHRINDSLSIISSLDWLNLFMGHGFGGLIDGRSKVEITYLEVLYKQGLIGLMFWICIFAWIVVTYVNLPGIVKSKAEPYFLSVIFIYIESFTNPFLTNSIGMSMILISIVILHIFKKTYCGKELRGKPIQPER